MQKPPVSAIVVDITDIVRGIERRSDLPISSVAYESWLARMYSKPHAVHCVSASILGGYVHNFNNQREALLRNQSKLEIDPLELLPVVPWSRGHGAVWFMVKGDLLMMGTSRAVKRGWGDVYHRLSRTGH